MKKRTSHSRTHPIRKLGLLVVLVTVISVLGAGTALAADRWTDITDQQWINTYHVTAAQAATVAAGYPDGSFKPGLAVTRGQFAKMAVDGLGLGTANPSAPTFSDVPATHVFFPWVEGAHAAGIISGFPDGTFRPGTTISRQQADSILGLFLSKKELSLTGHIQGALTTYPTISAWYAAEGEEILDAFADSASLAPVHAPYAAYLVFHNVVQGSSRAGSVFLSPASSLTRAQAVALVLRVKAVTFTSAVPTVTLLAPVSGPAAGGNSVVISGTNFTGVASVKFGSVIATSFVVNSATQITAVAPAGTAGAVVDVIVTTPAGSSAASAATKYSYGVLAVTSLSPTEGPAEGGNAVVITGTGFTGLSGASAVKFGLVNATSYVVDSSTQITAVAPAGTAGATVDVIVTTPAGTSAPSAASKYTYSALAVTSLSPAAGPAAGGNLVLITGTGFTGLSGSSAVKFGAADAMAYVVNSATSITATAPAGTAGTTVDVVVTTPAGTSATSAASKYSYGVPTVTSLAPDNGPVAGGNTVVITGTGFTGLNGAAAVRFGLVNASSYVVDSPTQITAVAPAGTNGISVFVTVTNPAGTSATGAGNTYSYGVPTVSLVSPSAGSAAGGETITITGTNFVAGTTVAFGANAATGVVVNSATSITATAPAGTAGTTVDVVVTTPAGTSATSAASKYSYGVPTVTSLAPDNGPVAGGNTVVITGTGFTGLNGAAAVRFGLVNASSYVVDSPTQITAVAPAGTNGISVFVTVTNPAGTSATGAGNTYSYGVPTVSLVSPSAGSAAGGETITITGTNFVAGTTVAFGANAATGVVVNSATSITATAPAGTAGTTVDVVVTTPAGTSATSAASKYSYGVPTVTSLAPNNGPVAGGNTVVITGTGFTGLNGAAAVRFGLVNATSYVVDSPTQITVLVPAGALGTVDVTVANAAGTSALVIADEYTYN